MDFLEIVSLLAATLRFSTPLLLACLAGLYSERSGLFDIGLEGKMLFAAFAAGAVAAVTANMWLGLLAAVGASMLTSSVQGAASISLKGNQIIAGVAINMLAAGLTTFLGQSWFGQGGRTPPLPDGGRFPRIRLPFATELSGVPIIGPIYSTVLSGHYIFVYVAFLMVPVTAYVLFHTRFGLRLRAVGENPKAIDTAGISVTWMRYQALIITAVLVGIGGAYLSIAQTSGFINNMSAGRGYIALAALIFAKWRPWPALLVCLMFGYLDAVQLRLQGRDFPIIGEIPVQAIQALPYILTIILLAGFIGKAVAPKASGLPYTKER